MSSSEWSIFIVCSPGVTWRLYGCSQGKLSRHENMEFRTGKFGSGRVYVDKECLPLLLSFERINNTKNCAEVSFNSHDISIQQPVCNLSYWHWLKVTIFKILFNFTIHQLWMKTSFWFYNILRMRINFFNSF